VILQLRETPRIFLREYLGKSQENLLNREIFKLNFVGLYSAEGTLVRENMLCNTYARVISIE